MYSTVVICFSAQISIHANLSNLHIFHKLSRFDWNLIGIGQIRSKFDWTRFRPIFDWNRTVSVEIRLKNRLPYNLIRNWICTIQFRSKSADFSFYGTYSLKNCVIFECNVPNSARASISTTNLLLSSPLQPNLAITHRKTQWESIFFSRIPATAFLSLRYWCYSQRRSW